MSKIVKEKNYLLIDALIQKLPLKESVKKGSKVGVIGTLPAIMGTLEANETIKFIFEKDEQILQRKILIFEGYNNKIKVMKTRILRRIALLVEKIKK